MTKNQLSYWQNEETKRSNVSREIETRRANQAAERQNYLNYVEAVRHNKEMEKLENQKNTLQKYANQTNRTSVANNYMIGATNARENVRSNRSNETLIRYQNITARQNAITSRLNYLNEQTRVNEQNRISLLNLAEIQRSNQAREQEILRSNVANESIRKRQNYIASQTLAEQKRHNVVSEKNQVLQAQYALVGSLSNAIGRTANSLLTKKGATLK